MPDGRGSSESDYRNESLSRSGDVSRDAPGEATDEPLPDDSDGRHTAPEDDTQHTEFRYDHIAEPQPDDNPESGELAELDDDGEVDGGIFTPDDVASVDFSLQVAEEDVHEGSGEDVEHMTGEED